MTPPDLMPSSLGDFPEVHRLFEAVDLVLPLAFDNERRIDQPPKTPLGRDDARLDPFLLSSSVWSDVVLAIDALNTFAILVRDAQRVPAFSVHPLFRVALERLATALWHLEPRERPERLRRAILRHYVDVHEREGLSQVLGSKPGGLKRARLFEVARELGVTFPGSGVRKGTVVSAADLDDETLSRAFETARRGEASQRRIFDSLADVGIGNGRLVLWKTASGVMHGQQSLALATSERVVLDDGTRPTVYVRMSPDERILAVYSSAAVDDLVRVLDLLRDAGSRWTVDLAGLDNLRVTPGRVRFRSNAKR